MRRILSPAALGAVLILTACAAPGGPAKGDRALEDLRILSADDMQGRRTGTPGGEAARAYVEGRMRQIGLQVVQQPFSFQARSGATVQGANLIGRIEGRDAEGPVMVVTAHFDHLGVHDGEIYNGADDNASGVAGLLAVAEALKAQAPKHTVYIVALDAEEQGLQGARAFVAGPPIPLGGIALNINLDMISKNDRGEFYASGGSHNAWIKARLDELTSQVPVTLKQGHDTGAADAIENWTWQSDHYVFHQAGVPWVYFGVEDHPEYHEPSDDFATVPQAFFKDAVATVVSAVRLFDEALDGMPARP